MEATIFGFVVVGVVVVGVVVAIACGVAGRGVYERIGRGGLVPDGRPAGGIDEREEEIRQMEAAIAEHRPDRATPPEAPDSGVPHGDPALTDELRQLALARNVRRRRQGLEPLDVDEEVARRLNEI